MSNQEPIRVPDICRASVLLITVSVLPTVLNQFLFVHFNSGTYISAWMTGDHVQYPAFYTLFVWLKSHAFNIYFTVVAQTALSICVLWDAATDAAGKRLFPAGMIALILLLAQLPGLINWLMPDLFYGLGAVCTGVFFAEALRVRDKIPVFCIAAFSATGATASVLVLIPFGVVCVAPWKLLWRDTTTARLALTALLFGAAVIGSSVAANLAFILGLVVHGALAMPDARYQVTVSWVAWAVATVCIRRWREGWTLHKLKSDSGPQRPCSTHRSRQPL
jgi:hypothetical protein